MKYLKAEEKLGLINKNNFGTEMKIIKVIAYNKVIVEFQDEYKAHKEIYYNNFKRGTVKNPYDKTVCGVGYIGEGDYKTIDSDLKNTKIYDAWNDMLSRCYKMKSPDIYLADYKHDAYIDCEVCEEWHNYQIYAKWYEQNFYNIGEGRMHLDKDILKKGNRIYCPEYCIFVPQRINMLFASKTNKDNLPSGISKSSIGRYRASYNTKSLGTYDTIEEALKIYNKEKQDCIHNIAKEYKDKIPDRLYKALINYDFQ